MTAGRWRQVVSAMSAVLLCGALLLVPPVADAGRTSRPTADPAQVSSASTMLGDRRIAVPSGRHFYGSELQSMSANLGHVVVRSGSDLTVDPEDEILGVGAGIFDLVGGKVVRLECPLCIAAPAITNDGTAYVGSTDHPLVAEDIDGALDLYLFHGDEVHLITHSTGMAIAGGVLGLSEDAAFVLLTTFAKLDPADTDNTRDFYRWSRDTGDFDLITPGQFTPTFRAMSTDGERILFETGENIGVPNDPPGETIYQWAASGITVRGRGEFNSVSADWSRVYMTTTLALDPADLDDQVDGYVRDASGFHVLTEPTLQAATLGRVKADGSKWVFGTSQSLHADDTDATGDAYLGSAGSPALLTRGAFAPDFLMAADFQSGIYDTFSQLSPADTDDLTDVYRWSAAQPSSPELLSGPADNGHVTVLAISDEGSRALLSTSGQLTPDDDDSFVDVYEHVGGALALVLPGSQPYDVEGWTPDLKRIVVSGGSLSAEDTNGNTEDVYFSDADLEAPTVVIPAPGVTGPNPSLAFGTAADDGVWFECRVDAGAWAPCVSPLKPGPLPGGGHQLHVRGYDAAGNPGEASRAWTVDGTAPLATAPIDTFVAGTTVNSAGATPVRFTWTASDPGSGVARHEFALSTNGGAYVTLSASLTSPSFTRNLAKGGTYRARVRAVDGAGNAGAWTRGLEFSLLVLQESSASISRSGTWTKVSNANAWGSAMRYADNRGDRLRLQFGGRSLAIVGRVGSNEGAAKIYINGVLAKKVTLFSATTAYRRVIYALDWPTEAVRTVEIRVVGTDGHPRVYIDALVIGT